MRFAAMARLGRVKGWICDISTYSSQQASMGEEALQLHNGDPGEAPGEVAAERKLTGPLPTAEDIAAWFAIQSRGRTEAFRPEARGSEAGTRHRPLVGTGGGAPLSTSRSKESALPSRPRSLDRGRVYFARGVGTVCVDCPWRTRISGSRGARGRVRSRWHAGQKFMVRRK